MVEEPSWSGAPACPVVKVPRNRRENRHFKSGFVDDNNTHLSYFNFPILWPVAALSFAMYAAFLKIFVASSSCLASDDLGSALNRLWLASKVILKVAYPDEETSVHILLDDTRTDKFQHFRIGVVGSLYTDDLPNPLELRKAFWTKFGTHRYRCNSTVPFPKDALPSILNLFEINVVGNVMLRLCSCMPIAVRLFVVYCRRTLIRNDFETSSFVHNMMNDAVPLLTFVELFAMALFSIVTIRRDSPGINRYCKTAFVITAGVNMFITSAVIFAQRKNKSSRLDSISMFMKIVSASAFCYVSPHYFQHHQASISYPVCHAYLPRLYAIMEYVMLAAYGVFHLTSLIDIRHITFLCYPRTCSGECEPLDPQNFRKNAKYEHCRAYEYQQRLDFPLVDEVSHC